MGSSRLPGKSMADVCGFPLIQRVLERLFPLLGKENVFVATTASKCDDVLAAFVEKLGVPVFRGPEEDVLKRYIMAAEHFEVTETIVRATADDPLTALDELKKALDFHIEESADYTGLKGLPIGAQEEVVSLSALKLADTEKLEKYHREHVVDFIQEHPECFRVRWVEAPAEYRREDLRFTVDEAGDLEVVRAIVKAEGADVSLKNIISFLDEHPDVRSLNGGV